MLSNSAIASVPFERVWSRMTAAEAALVLVYANLAASVPAVASHLTAEGGLTAWGWNEGAGLYVNNAPYRYAGGVFSSDRRPDQVRPLLQASYESDRAAFIDAATDSDDARGWALVDELPPVHPGPRALTPIVWWAPTEYDRHLLQYPDANVRGNLVKPLQVFRSGGSGLAIVGTGGRTTPALIAAYLAAQPTGCRAITMGEVSSPSGPAWGFPVSGGAANGRVAMFEREFDHATRRGIGLDTWQTAMLDPGSDWIAFWDDLLAEGEALLGVGHGHELLDFLVIDVERAYPFWKLQLGGSFTLGGETWTDIFADAGWSTLRTDFFKPELSQVVWNGFASWSFQTDERAFAIDAVLRDDYVAKTAPVWEIPRERFPGCLINEYDHAFHCAGTRPVVSAAAVYCTPYGNGGTGAARSAFAAYGADFIAEWRRWHWPTLSQQLGTGGNAGPASQRVWRMLVAHLSMIQSVQAASSRERTHYFSNPHETQTIFGIAGDLRMWAELTLHGTLAECNTVLYTYSTAKLAHYQAYIDLVAERDQIVGHANAAPEPEAPFDELDVMRRPALVTKVFAGWRWIWRVTPNPFLAAPAIIDVGTISGPGIRFDWGGGRYLEIPRGKIVRVANTMATGGYWVEQELPKRFRYGGSVPVGTEPVQIVPAPLPNWARRLLLRLDVDASDLVHLGNSSSVNATDGNANCGMPLDAGEEHTYELSRDVDGGDETGVWAKAASGTQHVHWWCE